MSENLKDAGLEEADIMKILAASNVAAVKEVFYAGLDSTGYLYVSKKHPKNEQHGKYGIE
jgi:uncharacterized membrane protein YcaP (DUF421 family)